MSPRKPRAKVKGPLESAILRSIGDALKWRTDVEVWRTNTGAHRATYRDKQRFVRFGVVGGGDITGLIKPWGVHLEIEVKREGGEQTENQEKHERRVRSAGGVYILARSAGEAMASLDSEINVLKERFEK